MTDQDVKDWLDAYGDRWSSLDPDGVLELMDKDDIEYHYDPFSPPFTSWQQVNDAWQSVRHNQKDVSFKHEVLLRDHDKVLVHVDAERTMLPEGKKEVINGAFLFGFSESGKCNYFRQWRVLKK